MNMRELLTGWMNGQTLQSRSRNPAIARSEGWRDVSAFDPKASGLSLPPGREYRLKPKTFTLALDEQQMETLHMAIADYKDHSGMDDSIESLENAVDAAEAEANL
jgi:hypothetical protein